MTDSILKEPAKTARLFSTDEEYSKENPPVFSIIIPAFNSQAYLSECLDSIERQNFDRYEVIIVNDGSSDNTEKIAQARAAENSRIRCISQANQGLSGARNTGIRNAAGEYLLLLDADDAFVSDSALALINKNIEASYPDLLQFRIRKLEKMEFQHDARRLEELPVYPSANFNLNAANSLVNTFLLHPSGCNKAISRKLIQDNDLYFEMGVTSEDIAWSAKAFSLANTICAVDEELYAYRQHTGSISKTITPKNCGCLVHALEQSAAVTESETDQKRNILEKYMAYQTGTFFAVQAMSDQKPVQALVRAEKLVPYLLKNAYEGKLKVLAGLCRTLGFEKTCSLIRSAYNLKRRGT